MLVWWICNLIRPNQLRLLLDASETHHDRHQKWGDKREVLWFFTYIKQQNCLTFFLGKHINVNVVLPYGSKFASKPSIHQRKHQWFHNGQLHPTSETFLMNKKTNHNHHQQKSITITKKTPLLCSKIHQEPREATASTERPSTERERSSARPLARRRSHEVSLKEFISSDPLGEFVSSNLI